MDRTKMTPDQMGDCVWGELALIPKCMCQLGADRECIPMKGDLVQRCFSRPWNNTCAAKHIHMIQLRHPLLQYPVPEMQ